MKRAILLVAALAAGAAGGAAGRWWYERSRPAREAFAAERAGDARIAGRWAEEALGTAPDDPALLGLVARGRESQGDIAGAAQALGRIVNWTPADRLTSARLFRRTGQHAKADAEAVRLVDTPHRAEALRIRAWAARMRDAAGAAVDFAQQAVAAGERVPGLAELVVAQYDDRKGEAALESCRALFAEPGWAEQPESERFQQLMLEVKLLVEVRRVPDALAAAAKWPAGMLKLPRAMALRGQAKMVAGDLDGALADLGDAISGPDHPVEAVFDMAEVMLKKDQPEGVLSLLETFERMPDAPPRSVQLRERAKARLKAKPPEPTAAPPAAKK